MITNLQSSVRQSYTRDTARLHSMSSDHCQRSDFVFRIEPNAGSTTNNAVSPIPATPHLSTYEIDIMLQDERSRDLREMIISTSKGEWVFEWIRKLKNWEKAMQYEDKCHQLTFNLFSKGTIDRGSRVRDKLGILQTEMPAWTILDHIKMAAGNRSKRLQSDVEPEKIMKDITEFVEDHVALMLEKLYDKLRDEEEKLKNEETSLDQPRKWLKSLTSMNVQNGAKMLFGPVGERPLHVCSLSAHRFGNIDFLGQGNYMKDGILNGMKRFLESKDNWNEVHVGYGKDYCALISSFVDFEPNIVWGKTPPPLWSSLSEQFAASHSMIGSERKKLSKLGLYEGETIAYPMIASGDDMTLRWILEAEKRILEGNFWNRADETTNGRAARCEETAMGNSEPQSLVQHSLKGLFFLPMQRSNLTSFSVQEGWHYYFNVKKRDTNTHASSPSSYFGLSMLAFAASQEKTNIFDLILDRTLGIMQSELKERIKQHTQFDLADLGSDEAKLNLIRRAVLNSQDEYGNTMLHVAAKNAKTAMYDHLIEMGADSGIQNLDGLSPFTMTTRFGIWDMFNHIWDHHLTVPIWRFGNVEKSITNLSEFDWKGPVTFSKRRDIEKCLHQLLKYYTSKREVVDEIAKACDAASVDDSLHELKHKISKVNTIRTEWCRNVITKSLSSYIQAFLGVEPTSSHGVEPTSCQNCGSTSSAEVHRVNSNEASKGPDDLEDTESSQVNDGLGEKMSGIRLITLFRPEDWYKQTRGKVEKVILEKWAQGFYLIHIGSSIVPYCIILLLFGLMWWHRRLHILEHNFWWADDDAVQKLHSLNTTRHIFKNPIKANISELEESLKTKIFGSSTRKSGIPAEAILGQESSCGWKSIASSQSGRLQATLLVYGVPALLRIAYSQRRIRPSDLDEDEDMIISFDEMINFIYFNLESLLHLVMCGLFTTIFSARVSAGEECDLKFLQIEKNATSMASLFLFFNFFVICKPYEGIGLLVLTIYKFLVSDVFNFLFMYSVFFVSFLLALQTLHNSNFVYLSWMDITEGIVPQIVGVTDNLAYLQNADAVANTRLEETNMAMGGCHHAKRTLQDTAFSLLEISFGDGLADALEQARRLDYDCPGYQPDGLTGYLVVFWVFLTNVLVLNMLIAMMNYTFDRQSRNVRSVWILDVSYRIMRYERLFPELVARLQRPVHSFSFWNGGYWTSFLSDALLVLYCLPEVHLWGYGRVIFLSCWRCASAWVKSSPDDQKERETSDWDAVIDIVLKPVRDKVDKLRKSESASGLQDLLRNAKSIRVKHPSIRLELLSRSSIVQEDLKQWAKCGTAQDSEETRHALLLVSLIYELRLMQDNFDEQRSVARVRVLGGASDGAGQPGGDE